MEIDAHINDENMLSNIALNDLRGLAEILEDMKLSGPRHDEIKAKLGTIKHVIEKGEVAYKTIETLRNLNKENQEISQEKIIVLDARIGGLIKDAGKKNTIINELQAELDVLSKTNQGSD